MNKKCGDCKYFNFKYYNENGEYCSVTDPEYNFPITCKAFLENENNDNKED